MRARALHLVLVASLCSLAGIAAPAAAWAGWGAPVQAIPSGGDPFGVGADVGFDQAGDATVAALGTGGKLFVATRPAGSGSFSSGQLATAQRTSMAVSRNGAAVIAYRVSSTSLVVAYRPPGGSFDATAHTYSGSNIGNLAAGIDDNGNAVVAWLDGTIHVATSSGASFGAAQPAPLGAAPGFNGSGSVGSRDDVPRAFLDDNGDVLLAYLDGTTPTIARRAAAGAWDTTTLPGGAASLLSAAADPQSQHYIVGYDSAGTFRAYEGNMSGAAASGTVAVASSAGGAPESVAVRPGGSEDLAVWSDPSGAVQSASCMEGYQVTGVGVHETNGAKAAVTSGDDELAFLDAGPGIERATRSPGGGWTLTPYTVSNYGSFTAFGADYSGDALVGFVDYPSDTAVTAFPYSGAASAGPPATSTCEGSQPTTRPQTGTVLSCSYFFDTARDTCQATVGAVEDHGVPTGSVSFTSSNTSNGGLFVSGQSCVLSPIPGEGSTAGCSVQFAPGQAATRLTGTYGGDGTYAPSSGTFTICNNPQNGLASCNLPDVAASQCQTSPGSPLCQTTFAVCVSLWDANCIGFGTPPAPLQVCVSAWQNCNGFGGRQPTSATIDLSGLPASLVTPVSCDNDRRGVHPSSKRGPTATAAAGTSGRCVVESYINQNADSQTVRTRTTQDSEFQRRLDTAAFTNAVNLREATIVDSANRALDGVEATWEHLNANIPGAPPLRAVLAYKYVAAGTVHTLFQEAKQIGVPVTHIVDPLNDTECFNALDPDPSSPPEVLSFVQDLGRTCSLIVAAINANTVAALEDLKALKHQMALDVPFRTATGGGAPQTKARKPPRRVRRVRFRGLPLIGYGTATVALNHRARLRIAIPAWERKELRALKRRHVRSVRATLVMDVGRVPSGLHYHVKTPVTIWLVHPPRKHARRPAHRRPRR